MFSVIVSVRDEEQYFNWNTFNDLSKRGHEVIILDSCITPFDSDKVNLAWKLIRLSRDIPLTAAINIGLKEASEEYKYQTFIASDNDIMPYTLDIVKMYLDIYDVIYTDMIWINEWNEFKYIVIEPEWNFEQCLYSHYECGVGLFWKRELIDRIGLFDENYQTHDYEFMIRAASQGAKICRVPLPLTIYRGHENRAINNHTEEHAAKAKSDSEKLSSLAKWLFGRIQYESRNDRIG